MIRSSEVDRRESGRGFWSGLSSSLFRARPSLRGLLIRNPAIALPLMRWRYRSREGPGAVDRATEVVIEGFERSGNSFAVTAFQLAQSRPVRIAHHLHAAGQVIVSPALSDERQRVEAIYAALVQEADV